MPLSIWLAAFAISAAFPLAWWSASGARSAIAVRARDNLSAGNGAATDLRRVVLQQTSQQRVWRPLVGGMARQLRRVTPAGYADSLARRLRCSGLSNRYTVEQVLAAKLVTSLLGMLLGGALFLGSATVGRFLVVAFLAAVASFVPDVVLVSRADARQAEIERALADSLDQITVCVEAGLSFESAMARVAHSRGPLAQEFGRVLQDIQLGMPRGQALEGLLERTEVPDLRQFVHAFKHAERYGVPIAQVLRVQSTELRDKRRQRAEARAMKVPVKLVFPVVLCIFPALFIVVAGPAFIRIFSNF